MLTSSLLFICIYIYCAYSSYFITETCSIFSRAALSHLAWNSSTVRLPHTQKKKSHLVYFTAASAAWNSNLHYVCKFKNCHCYSLVDSEKLYLPYLKILIHPYQKWKNLPSITAYLPLFCYLAVLHHANALEPRARLVEEQGIHSLRSLPQSLILSSLSIINDAKIVKWSSSECPRHLLPRYNNYSVIVFLWH